MQIHEKPASRASATMAQSHQWVWLTGWEWPTTKPRRVKKSGTLNYVHDRAPLPDEADDIRTNRNSKVAPEHGLEP